MRKAKTKNGKIYTTETSCHQRLLLAVERKKFSTFLCTITQVLVWVYVHCEAVTNLVRFRWHSKAISSLIIFSCSYVQIYKLIHICTYMNVCVNGCLSLCWYASTSLLQSCYMCKCIYICNIQHAFFLFNHFFLIFVAVAAVFLLHYAHFAESFCN